MTFTDFTTKDGERFTAAIWRRNPTAFKLVACNDSSRNKWWDKSDFISAITPNQWVGTKRDGKLKIDVDELAVDDAPVAAAHKTL
jgi:hypothetical protein